MLLGTVVAFCLCYLHVRCLLLSTHGLHGWGVLAGRKKHKFMIGNIILRSMTITIDAIVLNPKGPNIFVQNGDAAHNSSRRQVVDYILRSRPRKNQLATAVRRRWMCHARTVFPASGAAGRQFFNVVVLSACWLCSWLCSLEGKKQTD